MVETGTSQGPFKPVHVRNDGGLDKDRQGDGGERWSDSKQFKKEEQKEFANGLDVAQKKKRNVKDMLRILA